MGHCSSSLCNDSPSQLCTLNAVTTAAQAPTRTIEHMLQGTRRVAVRAFEAAMARSRCICRTAIRSYSSRHALPAWHHKTATLGLAQPSPQWVFLFFSFFFIAHLISSGRGFHDHGLNAQSPKSGLSTSSNLSVEVLPKLHSLTKSYIASKTAFNTPKQTKHQLNTNQ